MPQFDVEGHKIDYVEIAEMTLDELSQIYSDTGMDPADAEAAQLKAHPAVWTAVLLISARRWQPTFDAARLGKLRLFDVINEVFPDDVEDDSLPPAAAVDEPDDESSSTAEILAVSGNRS